MNRTFTFTGLILAAVLGFAFSCFAQTKARNPIKKTAATAKKVQTAANEQIENTQPKTPVKKNSRAENQTDSTDSSALPQNSSKKNESQNTSLPVAQNQPKEVYSYEFTQKDFLVKRIYLEHDENGKGEITFEKKDFDEPVTDPLQLSPATLEKIKSAFQTLNFLDSVENYQSTIRQYPHLGTMKINLKSGEKQRAAEFNWTENKDAKALADEYRKIGEQFVWVFDIGVARANQPLEAPGLMKRLDSLLQRGEISDPQQMIPLLKQLSNDERIPLMARNRAAKLIKEIEKKTNGK